MQGQTAVWNVLEFLHVWRWTLQNRRRQTAISLQVSNEIAGPHGEIIIEFGLLCLFGFQLMQTEFVVVFA